MIKIAFPFIKVGSCSWGFSRVVSLSGDGRILSRAFGKKWWSYYGIGNNGEMAMDQSIWSMH